MFRSLCQPAPCQFKLTCCYNTSALCATVLRPKGWSEMRQSQWTMHVLQFLCVVCIFTTKIVHSSSTENFNSGKHFRKYESWLVQHNSLHQNLNYECDLQSCQAPSCRCAQSMFAGLPNADIPQFVWLAWDDPFQGHWNSFEQLIATSSARDSLSCGYEYL